MRTGVLVTSRFEMRHIVRMCKPVPWRCVASLQPLSLQKVIVTVATIMMKYYDTNKLSLSIACSTFISINHKYTISLLFSRTYVKLFQNYEKYIFSPLKNTNLSIRGLLNNIRDRKLIKIP